MTGEIPKMTIFGKGLMELIIFVLQDGEFQL